MLETRDAVLRRLETASDYHRAADRLRATTECFGPAATILEVLAFEILLKAALKLHGVEDSIGHDYRKGWSLLPTDVRRQLVHDAGRRLAGHLDFSDMEKLMAAWGRCFTDYRYSYEVNEKRTLDEIRRVSEQWDGSDETADFSPYPTELLGLIESMQDHLHAELTR